MSRVLVVADDLTGANATGALFARLGLRTRTVCATGELGPVPGVDVLVVTTASRHLPPTAAAERVRQVLNRVAEPALLVKRVDTTLRGPVAAELAALLAERRARSGRRTVAVAVPAYPAAGRTTVGGIHLVDGVPLADSPAGSDPLTPVRDSRVGALLTHGTRLDAREVHLDVLGRGTAQAADVMARAWASGADVVVVDAVGDADLRRAARAVATARERAGVDVVVVDSGPFGAIYSDAVGIAPRQGVSGPLLLVVGSPAARTREQMALATLNLGTQVTQIGEQDLDPDLLATRIRAAIDSGSRVVGWQTATPSGDLDAGIATRIPAVLALATRMVLRDRRIGGLLACGGDVAAALLDSLDGQGIDLETEIQPLVVAGRLAAGPWRGLPIVTKGGLIGDRQAIVAAVAHLQSMQPAARTTPHTPEVASR